MLEVACSLPVSRFRRRHILSAGVMVSSSEKSPPYKGVRQKSKKAPGIPRLVADSACF